MIIRPTRWTVGPESEPLFSEMQTVVEIEDEAAGEFVTVSQTGNERKKMTINPDEWPAIREAINQALSNCRV